MPKKQHRRRLIRAERDALAAIADPTRNDHAAPGAAHRHLEQRALIRAHDVRIAQTVEHEGTPRERRTARKLVLYLLTLRGAHCAAQLRANGERGFDRAIAPGGS